MIAELGIIICLILLFTAFICIYFIEIIPARYWIESPLKWVLFQQPKASTSYESKVTHILPTPSRKDGIPVYWNRSKKSKLVILYSHGNAENLESCAPFVDAVSNALNVDMLAWDYPGYSHFPFRSEERTRQVFDDSIEHVYTHLSEHYDQVVLWAYSLGTGPTYYLASLNPPKLAGVVTCGAYASIESLVAETTGSTLSKQLGTRLWWNSEEAIKSVQVPVLILHGQSDQLISAKHAKRLYKVSDQSKTSLTIMPNAGHTTMNWNEVLQTVRAWLSLHHISHSDSNHEPSVP